MAANSTWFTVASVFVAVVGAFGLGLLFVRGTNIERNGLVGFLTVVTAVVAGLILGMSGSRNMSEWGLVVVSLFSVTGFFFGRGIDMWLGARGRSDDARNATLGSDLSD
ncbi:MAG TPA: hypothetical protein VK934_07160 [Fimbriimonas sp.]|nr:hypothetical protein [Fimbriimonas sp.]